MADHTQSLPHPPHINYLNGFNGNFYLEGLDHLTRTAIWPYRASLDRCLSCVFLTTEEKKLSFWLYVLPCYLVLMPLYGVLTLACVPLAVVAFLVWMTFQKWKLPYRLSESDAPKLGGIYDCQKTVTFLNANLCLLPEFVSRINNLSNVTKRAETIGRIIVDCQQKPRDNYVKSQSTRPKNGPSFTGYSDRNSPINSGDQFSEFDTSTLEHLPSSDFLLLTEGAWDMVNAKIISQELHKVYPYVIYDVAAPGMRSNFGIGPSGLMFASKYPLLKVHFCAYSDSCKQCLFASKGLLQVKVLLGNNDQGQNVCGYVFLTHLQVYQGDNPVQYNQLNEIVQWTEQFRADNSSPDDVIAFDVFGGDFNFDNMSPADRENREHEVFSIYRDLGRIAPGRDQPWARGSEMRQPLIHDAQVSTPHGLAAVLADDILSQVYLLDGDIVTATMGGINVLVKRDHHGNVIPSKTAGRRRIDYMMPRKDLALEVLSYNSMTAFAGLTDHIPVFLALKLPAM